MMLAQWIKALAQQTMMLVQQNVVRVQRSIVPVHRIVELKLIRLSYRIVSSFPNGISYRIVSWHGLKLPLTLLGSSCGSGWLWCRPRLGSGAGWCCL